VRKQSVYNRAENAQKLLDPSKDLLEQCKKDAIKRIKELQLTGSVLDPDDIAQDLASHDYAYSATSGRALWWVGDVIEEIVEEIEKENDR